MNIKELQYFKVVCEQKSITKAASVLYMTPQGLSKVMKNIEAQLEASLLIRTGAGVHLTESGKYGLFRGGLGGEVLKFHVHGAVSD